MLRAMEAKILTKGADLSKFESEYREVLAQFTEMTSRYTQEMQSIDELLKQRDEIHDAYNSGPPLKYSTSKTKIRSSPKDKDCREDGEMREMRAPMKDKMKKKKWYNIPLRNLIVVLYLLMYS